MGKRTASSRLCSVVENGEPCSNIHYARGMCSKHYQRDIKYGDPLVTVGTPWGLPPMRRFMRHVEVDAGTGCWMWTGGRWGPGRLYGQWHPEGHGGRAVNAHIWAYEQFVGLVPEGLQLDHFFCDTPLCVNPEHVRPASPRENVLRSDSFVAWNLAKTHCKRGHEFTPENTYLWNGGRHCRACRALADKESRRAKRESRDDNGTPSDVA